MVTKFVASEFSSIAQYTAIICDIYTCMVIVYGTKYTFTDTLDGAIKMLINNYNIEENVILL